MSFSTQTLKLLPTSCSFSFSSSRQDFGRTGKFLFAHVLFVVAFNACEPVDQQIALSRFCLLSFQVRVANIPSMYEELNMHLKTVRVLEYCNQLNSVSDVLLVLLLKFIDNYFAIAIIRFIYIYSHFITVYISLYLFTYLFFNCFGKPPRQFT